MKNTIDLSTTEKLDRLSAMLDGELSESEFDAVLDCLDDDCCSQFKRYQLIGDVMRDNSLAIATSDLFSVRLAKAIQAEPVHSLDASENHQQAQIHSISSKTKKRYSFLAGGVAAAFATIVTYQVFQNSDIPSTVDSSTVVMASNNTQSSIPESSSRQSLAQENTKQTQQQSFSQTPTVAVNASASSSRSANEERRRTYPEYLRSHGDMSANTPFMQVNYQSLGVNQ